MSCSCERLRFGILSYYFFQINIENITFLTRSDPMAIFIFLADNTYLGELARENLTHLKTASFAFLLSKWSKLNEECSRSSLNMEQPT